MIFGQEQPKITSFFYLRNQIYSPNILIFMIILKDLLKFKKKIIYLYFSSNSVLIKVIEIKISRMIYLRTFPISDLYRNFEPCLKEINSINIGFFVQ